MDCPECADYELRQRHPMWWRLNQVLAVLLPEPRSSAFDGLGRIMAAALGAPPEPTWYERHRQQWEATGDVIELERMTRHLK